MTDGGTRAPRLCLYCSPSINWKGYVVHQPGCVLRGKEIRLGRN